MRSLICAEGAIFRLDLYGSGSMALINKKAGQCAFMKRGIASDKFNEALSIAYLALPGASTDELYGWLWTNAGYWRLA